MRRLILSLVMLAASCASAGPREVVTATEFRFSPERIEASGPLRIELRNEGTQPHELRIEGTHTHIHAEAGKRTTAGLRLKRGTYRMVCELTTAGESHSSLGMTGTLVVR